MPQAVAVAARRKRDPDLLRGIPLFAGLTETESTVLGRLPAKPGGAAARLRGTLRRGPRHTDDLGEDAAFLEVRGRLARLILSISEGKGGGPDRLPPVRLTQGDLAALIGASRESVNRWLKVFAQKGAIRMEKGVLHIVDRESLRA